TKEAEDDQCPTELANDVTHPTPLAAAGTPSTEPAGSPAGSAWDHKPVPPPDDHQPNRNPTTPERTRPATDDLFPPIPPERASSDGHRALGGPIRAPGTSLVLFFFPRHRSPFPEQRGQG